MLTRKRVALSLLALLLLIGGGYALYSRNEQAKNDEQVDKIREMARELAKESADRIVSGEIPRFGDERSRERGKEIRDALRKLPEDQRRDVGMEVFFDMIATNADAILQQPPAERKKALDIIITAMEAARMLGGNRSRRPRDENSKSDDGERRRRGPVTQEQKERFFKGFLDSTSAQNRAKVFMAMQMFNDRRVERGYAPLDFGRRRNRDRDPNRK